MMKINLTQIQQTMGARQEFSFSVPVAALVPDDECWLDGTLEVQGQIVNTGGVFVLEGTITAVANQECHRCLRRFSRTEVIAFRENYRQDVEKVTRDEVAFNGDEIDIADLVRENMLLAEPIKILCSESCRGLCTKCGADLNQGQCSCDHTEIDPRLASLQKLLQKL